MDEILHQYSNACGHRKAQTPRTPQFNVVSCLVCVMQDFGHSTFLCFTCFLHSMLKREREGIYEFVLPLVQDFVHQPYDDGKDVAFQSGKNQLSFGWCPKTRLLPFPKSKSSPLLINRIYWHLPI